MSDFNDKKVFLWSGPRNISTALMYSFAQRQDTMVVDEPLYAHYLSSSSAKPLHPGAEDILSSMETNGEIVIEGMKKPGEKPVTFYKHMSHHLIGLDWSFMKSGINIILTRDPKEMLLSFSEVIEEPKMSDIGYAIQLKLLEFFTSINLPFVVLDAKKVLQDPKAQLEKLCDFIGIPFDQKMLSWQKGPIPEDGVWAKYWYKNVHLSTGFQPYRQKNIAFPDRLVPLLKECQPIYYRLLQEAF